MHANVVIALGSEETLPHILATIHGAGLGHNAFVLRPRRTSIQRQLPLHEATIAYAAAKAAIVRLAESLSVPGSYVHRDVNPDDSISDAAIKVLDASIQSLSEMRAQLSSMPIDTAAKAMATARQIAFAGLGASGHVARDACHKFFRLGIPCSSLLDTPMILQFAAIAEPDDVLVLLSHSGRWQEFAQAANIARERDATVIAITNPDSDLADSASILFPCRVIEDTNVFTPTSSRLGQLALLDALLVALALTLGSGATERLRLSKDALQRCR